MFFFHIIKLKLFVRFFSYPYDHCTLWDASDNAWRWLIPRRLSYLKLSEKFAIRKHCTSRSLGFSGCHVTSVKRDWVNQETKILLIVDFSICLKMFFTVK